MNRKIVSESDGSYMEECDKCVRDIMHHYTPERGMRVCDDQEVMNLLLSVMYCPTLHREQRAASRAKNPGFLPGPGGCGGGAGLGAEGSRQRPSVDSRQVPDFSDAGDVQPRPPTLQGRGGAQPGHHLPA